MAKYNSTHIAYHGESNGVHHWATSQGQPYYWHPDWLHIAEDATGLHPKQPIEVEQGASATKEHAVQAILKHLNDWVNEKMAAHPDLETQAHEREFKLKK
ncbi:hypothetical protein RCJ22_16500 [Vibrio sp. FNV 38]|nr:hypothetical protein [Vibrio sp. FNV 38]